MDTPLAHLETAVTAWSASRDALRESAGAELPGQPGSLEDDVERQLEGQAHNEWEGGEDDGFGD